MKILVVGSGAREHALAEAFHRSPHQPHVIVSPGNAGIGREFEITRLDSFEDIEDYCIIEGFDFVFIGPEQPLAEGLSDHLRNQRIAVIGPSKAAARIESSKIFAKNLMSKYNIPTSKFDVFTDMTIATESLDKWMYPIVIKADGLAAGKGVYIAQTKDDAIKVITDLMHNKVLGDAGNNIIIEEYLVGWEVSLFAFTDGENYCTTVFSQDHKQLYDGDKGPNTGGMGAYAPVPEADLYKTEIEKTIIEPTLKAMQIEGCPFQGVLYLGLMITSEGPKVIEYNCRLGDPETQTILPLLETDLVDICQAVLNHSISNLDIKWMNKSAICVYAVSKEYPNLNIDKVPISFSAYMDSFAFYGAVSQAGSELVTNGGRIIAITSVALTKTEARTKVYHDLNKVFFEGMHYRKDIGFRENTLK
jgi:phosphoribosylamine---glycine ligase